MAIKPSMRRFLDGGEENSMRALLPFFYAPPLVDSEVRSAFRREWSQLVETGPIADPTQIFLELAHFNEYVAELLQTVRSIEGFTVVCLTGRDTLDMITLARVFAGYVDDNCPHKFVTRIVSFGFTQRCDTVLRPCSDRSALRSWGLLQISQLRA